MIGRPYFDRLAACHSTTSTTPLAAILPVSTKVEELQAVGIPAPRLSIVEVFILDKPGGSKKIAVKKGQLLQLSGVEIIQVNQPASTTAENRFEGARAQVPRLPKRWPHEGQMGEFRPQE